MPSQALCVQVGLDDGWTLECGTKVGGRVGAMAAMVANLEPPGKALEEVGNIICSVRMEGQEGN